MESPPTVDSPQESAIPRVSLMLSRILLLIAFLAQLFVACRFRALTWDDSAITLGFARTFALTGRIEPTPGSGIVEGYSSTLWMLLMAVVAKLGAAPSVLLTVAKITGLLLNLANLILIRRWFSTWTSETVANLIAGTMGGALMFYETINGMETPLILTLILCLLLLLPRTSTRAYIGYLALGSAFVLSRWEAAWLLIPFVLIERRPRRFLISFATWLTILVLSNAARWLYFGSLLPNTIIAKRGAPYSAATLWLQLQSGLHEPLRLLIFCSPFLLVSAACLLFDYLRSPSTSIVQRFRLRWSHAWQLRFTILFTLFVLILSTATGANVGPPFRGFYAGLPFLFCLVLLPLALARIATSRILIGVTAMTCAFTLTAMAARFSELYSPTAPVYMPYATVDTVARTNSVIERVQSASHYSHIVFAGPDMGAILLYSNGVRVIDLGLLCNTVLARRRYAAVHDYVLEQNHPDIVEVHSLWTTLTRLSTDNTFLSRYRPVYIDGLRVFLTPQVIAAIGPAHLTQKSFTSAGQPANSDVANSPFHTVCDEDLALNQKFGTYLVLNESPVTPPGTPDTRINSVPQTPPSSSPSSHR